MKNIEIGRKMQKKMESVYECIYIYILYRWKFFKNTIR
nr:MAG TPA: hypothetical protein [Caudoviricetes sp.]